MQVLWVMVRSLKSILRAVGSQGIIYGRGLILIHSFRITQNHIQTLSLLAIKPKATHFQLFGSYLAHLQNGNDKTNTDSLKISHIKMISSMNDIIITVLAFNI